MWMLTIVFVGSVCRAEGLCCITLLHWIIWHKVLSNTVANGEAMFQLKMMIFSKNRSSEMLSYWKNCADVSHVGPCWVVLGSMLGLCWGYVGPRTACSTGPLCKGPVEHAIFGLCRGNVGPCWAMLGCCWANVGPWCGKINLLEF